MISAVKIDFDLQEDGIEISKEFRSNGLTEEEIKQVNTHLDCAVDILQKSLERKLTSLGVLTKGGNDNE